MSTISRRGFITLGSAAAAGLLAQSAENIEAAGAAPVKPGGPRLGLVTYQLAQDWDVPTIIKNCTEAGFEAVELRTTHAHKVEVDLSAAERAEVRKMFEGSPVRLASLGSAFEYDSPDASVLKRNIDGTLLYARLASDLGCDGFKVRPNSLHEDQGIPREKTIAQIADSLTRVGNAARDLGVEVRVEVHGRDTSRIPVFHRIMESCGSDNVFACWNCNDSDLEDGGLEKNFALLADKIHFVHMRDLFFEGYPWRKFLSLLDGRGYTGYCCAEIPGSDDPVRVMKYYRALFLAYQSCP